MDGIMDVNFISALEKCDYSVEDIDSDWDFLVR